MSEQATPCPYCAQHELDGCWHTPGHWELMTALANAVGDDDPNYMSGPDHAIGWEEDADCLLGDVGGPPYRVTVVPNENCAHGVEFAMIVNDILCITENHHGDDGVPLRPIVRLWRGE